MGSSYWGEVKWDHLIWGRLKEGNPLLMKFENHINILNIIKYHNTRKCLTLHKLYKISRDSPDMLNTTGKRVEERLGKNR